MIELNELTQKIKSWAKALGFSDVGICEPDLHQHASRLKAWLQDNYHGDMAYMAKNIDKREHPERLHSGTCRIISVRMDYLPSHVNVTQTLTSPQKAAISVYAQGRDYHKVMRKKLQKLAKQIEQEVGPFGYRAFTDSAPVLEKAMAEQAGLGFIGKNTNLIHPQAGSWFFLGELFTDLPLPVDNTPIQQSCGCCTACIDHCPTGAIVAPFKLDARRCISYLTIEYHGVIPEEFRRAMGNRVYGCDDCQLVCPWNKFASQTQENDFLPREVLSNKSLLELFEWSEEMFLKNTEGSAIRRIGYIKWLSNLAIGLGNGPYDKKVIEALKPYTKHDNDSLQTHAKWAIQELQMKSSP